MTDKKESIALYDAKTPKTSFALDELNKKITMEYGKEFTNVQIRRNGDYICVEPWVALTYALNDKRGLKFLSPDKKLITFLSIRVTENE